jgi:cyanophycinase-like exopeptidase
MDITLINTLIRQRDALRREGKYEEADKIRQQLINMGYVVIDDKDKTIIASQSTSPQGHTKPYIALFGSGETSPSGRLIHDQIFKKINRDNIKISLISTPAGFQPNIKVVMEEIADFFTERLTNYHPQIKIMYANSLEEANNPEVVTQLDGTDYIFIGPGSPTYAINNLRDSLLLNKIVEYVQGGTSICIASAAAIAFSYHALPVYELYKVGEPLHWIQGLDIFRHWHKRLNIIPHYNNNEGGEKNDTSRCYMGQKRFEKLLNLLPPATELMGIDENTACILHDNEVDVIGKGQIHEFTSTISMVLS